MYYIKFKKLKPGIYSYLDNTSYKMQLLASFFTSDVQCNGKFILTWLREEENGACSMNATHLEKANNVITLESNIVDSEVVYSIKKDDLIRLIEAWLGLCHNLIDEIELKYDGVTYSMVGKNND